MGVTAAWLGADALGIESTAAGVTAAGAAINTVAAGAAIYQGTKMLAPKMPAMPPSPFMPQAQVDQTTQDAEAAARRRQAGSQGIDSTVGAGPGGMLNPSSMSSKTLLGQ